VLFGITIPEPFLPAIVLPLLVILPMFAWPWIDARITGSRREHHLLDWWWEQPFRTATGAAFIAAFVIATLAGGNDVLGASLGVSVEGLTVALLWALLIVPPVAWIAVYVAARQRRRHEVAEGTGIATNRPVSTMLVRNDRGGFEEIER
jgi:ubiquinol-cytochrome c reductase cytochrome b subunit